MLLLPLLACLAAGPLTAALAGEPPGHANEPLLLSINELSATSVAPRTTPPSTTVRDDATPSPTTVPNDTTPPPTTVPDDDTPPPTTVPAETTESGGWRPGGREGGSQVEQVSPDTDATATTAGPSSEPTEPPADSGETTAAAAKSGDDAAATPPPDDDAAPTTAAAADDEKTTAATTAAADEHPTTVAAETTPTPSGHIPTTAPAYTTVTTPGDAVATTPSGQNPTTVVTEPPAPEPVPTTPEVTGPVELPVRLVSGEALRPGGQPTLSRHRADPGLAPSETKPSRARSGVPDPEMLDNPSKPRKGAPPSDEPAFAPSPASSGGLSVTEGTPVTGSVTVTQATPNSGGAGLGGDMPTRPSLAEKPAGQDGQPAPEEDAKAEKPAARPKPTEAIDAAGGSSSDGLRGSAVAGVVVLVLLIVAIGFFVFRKVREAWYRRHYRKMDFLVDGMYNL